MRVVVLGGTRFIGRAITEALVVAGHEVLVVHRGRTEPADLVAVEHAHVDRHDEAALRDVLADARADGLIDACALTGADAETAIRALPGDMRLVVLSSMDVYRAFGALHAGVETDPMPLDEASPVRAERYPYRGKLPGMEDYEKLDVEEAYLARGATVCRLPMVYGEHDEQRREEFILRRVRAGRTRIPIGSGTWLWSRGYVGDVAAGVRLACEVDRAAGEILNLGEARTWSIGHWARQILDAAASHAELVRVPDDALPDDLRLTGTVPQHLLVDVSKAHALLGWEPRDTDETVRRSVRWHLQHPPSEPSPDFAADDLALSGPPAR